MSSGPVPSLSTATEQPDVHALAEQLKLASLGEVVAGLAHEINTPLGSGLTAADLLAAEVEDIRSRVQTGTFTTEDPGPVLDRLAEISQLLGQNLQRIHRIVQAARGAGQRRALRPRVVEDLSMWLEGRVGILHPEAELAGARVVRVAPRCLALKVDTESLALLVEHLVHHALFRGFNPDTTDPVVQVGVTVEADHLLVEVTDNARRIPAELAGRVFEPFVALRGTARGTGLELHLAHAIATGPFGGHLRLETSPGAGHRAVASLPFGSPGLPEAPVSGAAPDIPVLPTITLNPDFPAELWVMYRDDLVVQARDIFGATEAKALRRMCHKLGGSAGLYGVDVLREAAVALQKSDEPLHDQPTRARLRAAVDATLVAVDTQMR